MGIPKETTISTSTTNQVSNISAKTSVLSVTLKEITPETTPDYAYFCTAGFTASNMATVSAEVSVKGMHLCYVQVGLSKLCLFWGNNSF